MFTIRRILIKWLVLLLNRQLPQTVGLREEMRVKMMAKAYQNQGLQIYLDTREEYIIHEAMDLFIRGKLDGPKGLAGQLLEIQSLRFSMKACYNSVMNERDRVSARQKLRESRKRRHSQ